MADRYTSPLHGFCGGTRLLREGVVHVFDLKGHMTATRAYAWSSLIEGSDERRFFAVLHQGPITPPIEAVRAAIVAEHSRDSRNHA